MTRWARGSDSNRKKVCDASNWSELKSEPSTSSKNNDSRIRHDHRKDGHYAKKSWQHQKQNQHFNQKHNAYSEQKKLKDAFMKTTDPKEKEIAEIFWKTERSDQRRIKRLQERQSRKVCYNCRQPGHQVSDCPEVKRDVEQGTGICFKCGSTEHVSSQCTAKVKPGTYPFAKCFVCGEMGHITKQCPDNPRGMYPNGGCCKMCGSVEHFKKDCPRLLRQQGIPDVTLERMSTVRSADDDPVLVKPKKSHTQPVFKTPKIVKF